MRGVCVRLGRNRQRPGKSVETVEVHRDSVHYTPLSVMLVCMCGIVGYAGDVNCPSMRALEVCLQGLERLEYRGYDSAGVALTAPGMDRVAVRKKAGRLSNLVEDIEVRPLPDATVAIGHTRWATNGVPNDVNAHPHASRDGKVAIIHNGIIENASQLRLDLQAEGYRFVSGTDTEVAAKLLGKIVDAVIAETGEPDLFEAMRRLGRMLEGAFTILAVDCRQPGVVVGARHDSPLVVGLGEGENFLGSDVAAFVAYTKTAMEIGQDQAVMIDAHGVAVTDFDGNAVPEPVVYEIDWDASAAEKGGWDSFMDKEIHEEPAAVQRTLIGRLDDEGRLNLDEVHIDEHDFKAVDKIIVIGCGTASYAGMVAKYAIEHWVRIPVEVELAHEFRYRDPILTPRTLVVAISQSGETMDTLMALRHAREQGSKVLAICNTQGASIPRESDAVLYTHAGPEVAVASTKAFVAQITAAYVLGLYLAQLKGTVFRDEIAQTLDSLKDMPRKIQWVLDTQPSKVATAARQLRDANSFLFLGRHVGYPVALEGALKLKEIAYTFTEGFAAGELKHGPIALVDEGEPVVFIVPPERGRNILHAKVISGIEEVKARGAYIIAVAEEGDKDVERYADVIFWRPECPTLMSPLVDVVPLQLLAMDMAKQKGYDVDKPRNLAKSVTVE
ncbi:glutamine--fructose-6-phosphate aminotransferase [Bifidobacterium pseudolongum subsp. pseudolongum]|uniref:Glutamine--fructose-6-phosphate aminotransferase [isomerizing] n=3 Tax=Bifidobacterium pseudolongum TaxID=1694 RepID=A0AB37X1P6_9BIFI|nr:glutamine fructose-6-phosphate transaminase [Bifidobacterium pseudolongum subsp. pseudolongum]RYQ38679.1 glutamine--fructose-6-phosphate aminotransferase [Bifidobacterium pseudolongum subsp. globosum]RYQ22115.1 glutamine--fructose-6-phosphate aminotransferase [Bifidobacterium pseudolongum subsp. pseudolongum]RYQ49558.1 glutamine--fructose-6-phosphate aminotransferase [Bifidobacterium pseudolongum subsp. pseudolongum]RYQ52311.1 glutamine--fructose-6-phosphate aminotransferase [Bifidobacterium